jgi:hypothetical protein
VGGLFRGKGGIDTNLAWLSDFEFVMNPKAVRHWGVSFMQALNSMRMPKGFAAGGLNLSGIGDRITQTIRSATAIPAYATGGLNLAPARAVASAGGGDRFRTPVNINIGGSTYTTMADDDVARALKRVATQKSFSTAGKRQEFI